MNEELQNYARHKIKAGLSQAPESHRLLFKRMYSHKNLDKNLNDIVDSMEEDKLDWAMQQVKTGLEDVEKLNQEQPNG